MDPCPFVRVLVGNLALKIPVAARPSRSGVHPSASPCYCRVRLNKFPYQTVPVPLVSPDLGAAAGFPDGDQHSAAAASRAELELCSGKQSIFAAGAARLKVAIYAGKRGTTCGVSSGRLLGKVKVPLDLMKPPPSSSEERSGSVFLSGWISLGGKQKGAAELHLTLRVEPDPRFLFEFDGEPECSPLVYQIQGSMRQPVFTCKFSCRNSGDRSLRSRSMQVDPGTARGWLTSFGSLRERPVKERKGWSVTVHDLCGAPVALASMVTPFVASSGTDRVSRSSPGAWLILRPGEGTWKPWGRLEAWRERVGAAAGDGLGYRFELLPDTAGMSGAAGISVAESTLSTNKGGRFTIDLTDTDKASTSPACSPGRRGGGGFDELRGFVMSASVKGEGRNSRPAVEVSVSHVTCAEDAAAFVALAAAVDLSMDACRLFSHRLRKELSF